METITSRQNGKYKDIKQLLTDKKYRRESGLFFVDGVNFVNQALVAKWEVVTLVYVPEKIDSDFKKEVLETAKAAEQLPISTDLYRALSSKTDIQGLGAVIRQKVIGNRLLEGDGVVLENIASPGNLGTICRLCAAFAIDNLYVIRPAVEFFSPETVRASMGAIFQVNLVEFDSLGQIEQNLRDKPIVNIGTSLQADTVELAQIALRDGQTTLFWFGSEAKGLSEGARRLCEKLVKIPISNKVDSLNVAESAAIVLYELKANK